MTLILPRVAGSVLKTNGGVDSYLGIDSVLKLVAEMDRYIPVP